MKKIYSLFCLILVAGSLFAQTTENFETEVNGSSSFTDNGQVFNITSQAQGPFDIQGNYPGTGWNGTSADNRYIDNDGFAVFNTPVQFTIAANGGTDFQLKSMYLFLSTNALNLNVSGSVTITGKRNGTTQFTATASAPFNTSMVVNNGFTFINMSTFGGSNNSNTNIDEFVITTTGNIAYVAMDAMNWQTVAACTTISSTGTQTNVSCNGGSNGTATVTPTSGTAPYTYSWAPSGGTGATASGLSVGTYTVTITDANGCTGTRSFTITQPTALAATGGFQNNISCNGGSNGTATVFASGGTAPYTYSWSPSGGTAATGTGLSAGTYTVTVTDSKGCTATRNFTITQPLALTTTASQTNVSCNGGSNGTATVTASGGTAPYTYSWAPSGGTANTASGLIAGNYTVTVTDSKSCTTTRNFTITEPATLSGSTVVTNAGCGTNGTINLTPSGGTGPYTYNWSDGPTTEDRTGLAAGSYSVTISDANGCTATVNATVGTSGGPSGTTVVTNVACNGGSNGAINLTPSGGTPPYTYSWNTGHTTQDRTGLTAGTYTVTITDANGCQATVVSNVTEPSIAIIGTTVVTNVSCFGGSNGTINLTPSGGTGPYTFNWNTGHTTEDRTGLTAGTYTVTITDANGCTGTVNATVTQPASVVSGTTVVTNVMCNGGNNGSINLTPSGGTPPYTFNWGGGITTEDRTGLAAGSYSVTITDANFCTATVPVTVTQPAFLSAFAVAQTNIACNGASTGSATVGVTGGTAPYTYSWAPSGATGATATGLSAGTHTVTVTDANGCIDTQSFTLTQPFTAVSGSTVVTNVVCFGGSTGAINLTPSGGTGPYTFNWNTGHTTEDRTGLSAGTYSVTITDANGCTGTVNVTVTQPAAAISGSTIVTNVACFGGNTGSINLTPSGGVPPYTYSWNTGQTTEDRTSLAAGTYTVTITDAFGCTGTVSVTVTQPAAPVSGTTVVTNVACNSSSTGAINLTPTGGTPPYTYNWGSSITTQDRAGLAAGNYMVIITDANGCTGIVTATVTQPATSVSGSAVVTHVTCSGDATGSINITPSGGTPPYTFEWDEGQTTEDRTLLAAGTYTVIISDSNNCIGIVSATVNEPSASVSGTTVITNVSCNGGSNGAVNLTPTGGTGPYTYVWPDNGSTAQDRTGLAAGAYHVFITDANGCTGTVVGIVNQPTVLSGTTVTTNVSCNGGSNGAINLTPSGGTAPYTFNWGGGVTTEDRTGLSAGAYTVIITDANGCTVTVNATIAQPVLLNASALAQTNIACNGAATGSATVTVTGGTLPYTYSWAPSGGTAATASGLVAGTYTVTVTDANGCLDTQSFTITQPAIAISGTRVVTNVACFGGSNGAINLTPSGGTGPYTFNWGGGITTEDRTGLLAGTYTVTITDANGCSGTVSTTVTQPAAAISGTTVVTNAACFGGSNGAINLTASGGTPPYTYNWGGGVTTEDRTGLSAGTYTVIITDFNGCTATVNATVTQPTAPLSGVTVITNVSCFGGSNGAINLTAVGGTAPYTFNWGSGITTEDRTGLSAGTYTVMITDANGCTATVNATVTQPTAPLSGTTVVTNVACNGGSNGAINLTPSGGTAPYTFNWGGGITTEDRTGLTAGTYTVTITDANGCLGTVSTTVTQPATSISGTTVVSNVACFGGSNGTINLTPSGGTAPYTFNWGGGITTEDRTGLSAGTYTVIITDANACTSTVSVTVTQPATAVSGTTVVTNAACFGGSTGAINLTPSGGTAPYTFNWGGGIITEDRTGLSAGTYTVIITDFNGCTATVNATVAQPVLLQALPAGKTDALCNGGATGSASVNAIGGTAPYTYSWSPSGGTAATATGLTAGNYTVTVTDANGCTAIQTYIINEPSALTATTSQTNVSCSGGSNGMASVTVSGGAAPYTYSWAPSGGTLANATGLAAGSYTVTITDNNGCIITRSFTITQPAALAATAGTQMNVSCNGGANGSATVVATGGTGAYTYSWSPSGGTAATATGLAAGTYTVTATDANGCTATQSFIITQPAALIATAGLQTNVSCNGGANGSATVNATGGTGAYTYSWSPSGGTGATANGLAAGTYTVTVTDANGCTATQSFTITQPAALVATVGSQTNVSCNGGANGSATVNVTGGTGTYTYSWSPSGGTGATATGLAAGTYTVTVTDANGCTATQSFTITQPAALVTTAGAQTNVSCNGGANGSAIVNVTGGTGAYTYSWSPSGGTGATANGLDAGTYTVTVTDANGCTATQSFTITQPAALVATVGVQTNILCNGGANGSATVNVTGGTGAYAYSWLPSGGTGATATGLTAGTYTVTVTDANGCTATQSFTITQPAALIATAGSQTNVSCNGGANGSATVNVTGGTGAYTYLWSPSGGTGATANGLAAGTYTVTVTDANGCTATQSFTITQPAALIATAGSQTNVSCNGGANGSATVNVTGGTGAYTYLWSPSGGTGATANGLAAGTYTVTVTDANGCTATQSFTITQPSALTATLTTTNVGCPGATDGAATVAVTGGTGAYTYSWSPSGGTGATATGLTAGTYTVTVTDANGCAVTHSVNVTTTPDVTAPVADVTTLPAVTNYCAVLASEIAIPTATDNCNGTITATTTNPLEYTAEGTYTITWNYDDGNGNTSLQTQTINVLASPLDAVTFDDAAVVYNTNVQTIQVANLPAGATVNYSTTPATGTGNGAVNAGVYTVTATVTPPATASNCDPVILTATLTIERAPQVIIFNPLAVMNLETDPDFQLGATATSGLPVYYTYTYTTPQPPATVTPEGFVDMLASGQVIITAHQDGNENYLPAVSVEQILIIESSNASISYITVGDEMYENPAEEIYYLIDCADSSGSVEVTIVAENNATVVPGLQFTIDTPVPGIYSQEVTVTSQDGSVTRTYTVVVEKRFDFFDIVVQKFDNVLLVNNNPATNGGYQFITYTWYKNDELIGTGQYYSAGENITDLLDPDANYYVRMTTIDGEVLQTCLGQIDLQHNFSSRLYPNPAVAGRSITVENDFPQSELDNMTISVYSLTGSLVTTLRSSSNVTEVRLPGTIEDATYVVILETPNIKKSLKVIVRK